MGPVEGQKGVRHQNGGQSYPPCQGKEDTRKLAREVRASFGLPWQLQELDSREATLQAPPAPPCLGRKRFMPPADSIFACRDIRQVPQKKVVAYARALQYWAEQNN